MPAAKHRLIPDINLWISFLLTSNYARLDQLLADNRATLLFSQELLNEFITVAQRPKFKNRTDAKSSVLASMLRIKQGRGNRPSTIPERLVLGRVLRVARKDSLVLRKS